MEKQQEKPTPQLERLNADLKRTIDLLEEQIFVLNEKLQKIHYCQAQLYRHNFYIYWAKIIVLDSEYRI